MNKEKELLEYAEAVTMAARQIGGLSGSELLDVAWVAEVEKLGEDGTAYDIIGNKNIPDNRRAKRVLSYIILQKSISKLTEMLEEEER